MGGILGFFDDALFGQDAGQVDYDPSEDVGAYGVVGNVNADAFGVDKATNAAYRRSLLGRGAPEGSAARLDATRMDQGLLQAGAARTNQGDLTNQLQAAASGQVPSAAELQMKQGMGQSIRSQLAMANSARGGTGASLSAIRGAQDQGAQMQMQGAQQAGIMRAQEQAQARGLLSQHLGGMRGQDMGQASLGLQSGQAQAGLDQQMTMQNMDAVLQARGMDDARMLGLGGLSQKANAAAMANAHQNSQALLGRDLELAKMKLGIESANATADFGSTAMVLGAGGDALSSYYSGGGGGGGS